jgi:hypothetical protein
LPLYQRQYSGSRYPSLDQQRALQVQHYRYQPRDTYVRQYYRQLAAPTSTQSANAYAPGQLKRQQNAQSAREFAPGQVKKREGAQSARDYAPGHVRKQQAQVATAPEQEFRDEGESRSHGQGRGHGQGQGHGKGKGHNKD